MRRLSVGVGLAALCGCWLTRDLSTYAERPCDGAECAAAPDGSSADAGAAPDGAPDAATPPPAPLCDPTKDFEAPSEVAGLASQGYDLQARLSADELTIYFASDRTGDFDIYVASRSHLTDAFGAPAPVRGRVNTPGVSDQAPTVTADGLTLYFQSGNAGNPLDIFVSTRPTTTADFGAPADVANVNSGQNDTDPFISADGNTLYFDSDRPDGGSFHLYRATRTAGVFGLPVALAINSSGTDAFPVLSESGLSLYFASSRTAIGAQGGYDIWVARRRSLADDFGSVELVPVLNTPVGDVPSWVSADDCRIYFTRGNATGTSAHIWQASRPK